MQVQCYEPLGLGAGSRIDGRYDVIRKLGAGGMSAVFEVVDRSLENAVVALKLFSPQLCHSEQHLRRFRNEVLITRRLTHTNIVRTFDLGETESHQVYMTMECVKGMTLEQVLRIEPWGKVTLARALRILRDVLAGLHYAHEVGVVHRDLKPGNILISDDGQIKLADFGLARAVDFNVKLTQNGECVGTPHYMAPEQVKGEDADARSDIYAVGIIAFELITGTVPFDEANWIGLANKILSDPLPEFATRRNGIPLWYQEMVKRATAKRREDRFSNAREMLEFVEAHLAESEEVKPLVLNRTERFRARQTHGRQAAEPLVLPRLNIFRAATIALPILVFAFLAIAVLTLTHQTVDEVAEDIKSSGGMVSDITDTLTKLKDAVIFAHTHKEEIHDFLDQQIPAAAPVAETPLSKEIAPDLPVITPEMELDSESAP